jgi:hypothetical protein
MSKRYHGNDLVLGTRPDGTELIWTEVQRRLHMYISGKPRSGKSRCLLSLIQQDLHQHDASRQGLVLFDPHGELYDGALAYIADHPELWHLPITLIDLRKDDWVTSYNLLRAREGIDPAVVAAGFVESITYAFGGADPTDTPRLARVARMFVQGLFDAKRTFSDVLPLLSYENSELRAALLAELPPSHARAELKQFNQLGKREFDTWVESFTNRISPMLSNRVIGNMLGQSEAPSFDFDRAIDIGAIVLVSLATERGKIADSDSRLFASLMINDLWQVAKLRGKKGAGYTKPFAVYADEFQSYLTPSLSLQLDQSSGFGLQFILANQNPGQLLDHGGAQGQAIYRSVMNNTGAKMAFKCSEQPEERAPLVAALFDGAIDVHRLETAVTSFQVVAYKNVKRILKGESSGDTHSKTTGTTTAVADSVGTTVAEGWVDGEGEAEGETSSRGRMHVSGHASMVGQIDTFSNGISTPESAGLDVPIPISTVFAGEGGGYTFGETDSDSEGESESETSARSTNRFHAMNKTVAKQVVSAVSKGQTLAHGEAISFTNSRQENFTLEPILEERPTQLMSVENQLFAFGQQLAMLPARHAITRLPGDRLPTPMKTLDCPEVDQLPRFIEKMRMKFITRTPCALTLAAATANTAAVKLLPPPDTDNELRIAAAAKPRRRGKVREHGNE